MERLVLKAVCLFLAAGLGAEASRPASNDTGLQQLHTATSSLVCFITALPCPRSDGQQLPRLSFEQHPAGLGASPEAPTAAPASTPNSHHHKPLLPLEWTDVVAMAATAAALVLAASGGVGGGPLLIPIFMLILGFRATSAVALSNVTIVGGTLTNFAFNVGRRHPLRPGPLIDWDLILVMEPSTILGALAGGYINHVLPPWITTGCLSLLLIFVTLTLLRRGSATFRKETLRLQNSATVVLPPPGTETEALQQPSSPQCLGAAQGEDSAASGSSGDFVGKGLSPPIAIDGPAAEAGPGSSQHGELTEPLLASVKDELSSSLSPTREPSLASPLQPAEAKVPQEAPQQLMLEQRWKAEVPFGKLSILLALLAGVAISDTVRTRLPCPSATYWLAAVAMVPIALLVLAGAREYLLRKHARLASAPGYVPPDGAVVWTRTSTVVYPLLCTFAGLVAGMFGLGGGIVKGPLMLEMGVNPVVAAATSATMILFTSTAASTVFISYGAVQWDYASLLFLVALVATAVGQLATKWVMRRMHGRSSIIVFAMAAFLGCSAVVLGVQGVFVTRRAFAEHEAWNWGSICGATSHT